MENKITEQLKKEIREAEVINKAKEEHEKGNKGIAEKETIY